MIVRFASGGIHLPDLGLWLDPTARKTGDEKVFVSHGHTDHLGSHREVILTEPTAWFMHARRGGKRLEHILSFQQPMDLQHQGNSFRLTLLPAGHVLGSAMAFLETTGQSLLYTGDFKLRPGRAAELCAPRHADVLIMETTFGRPQYQFPDPEKIMAEVIAFCRDTLAQGGTPLLLAYALGKSQELLHGLVRSELPIMVHDQIRKMLHIYEHFGQHFPPWTEYDPAAAAGKVLLWPPHANRTGLLSAIGPVRTAIVTGWALDSSCRYRSGTDAAYPLSDHADFPELIAMVQQVKPRKVLTLHGFAADFAQTLRELGFDARALSEDDQLWLPLG